MSFLPAGESLPKASNGRYMNKFEDGKTRFRILELPALPFYGAWKTQDDGSRKPVRAKTLAEIEAVGYDRIDNFGEESKPKYTLALKVFHYHDAEKISAGGEVKILQFTQKGIMEAMEGFSLSEDYRDLTSFDLTVSRSGQKMETKYTVIPSVPRPFSEEGAYEEAKKIDLTKLLSGENPFLEE